MHEKDLLVGMFHIGYRNTWIVIQPHRVEYIQTNRNLQSGCFLLSQIKAKIERYLGPRWNPSIRSDQC